MVDVKIDGRVTTSKGAKCIFPNFFEPKPVIIRGKVSGDPKYGGTLLLEPESDDLKAIKAKCKEVALARWPGRELKELAFPFKNGDKEAERAAAKGKDGSFYKGLVVIKANSKYEPKLAILNGRSIEEFEGDKRALAQSKFYSGCMIVAELNFVAYDGVGQNPDGITAYMNAVMKVGDGDRIGSKSTSDTFKAYVGQVSAEDPTAGAEDWE